MIFQKTKFLLEDFVEFNCKKFIRLDQIFFHFETCTFFMPDLKKNSTFPNDITKKENNHTYIDSFKSWVELGVANFWQKFFKSPRCWPFHVAHCVFNEFITNLVLNFWRYMDQQTVSCSSHICFWPLFDYYKTSYRQKFLLNKLFFLEIHHNLLIYLPTLGLAPNSSYKSRWYLSCGLFVLFGALNKLRFVTLTFFIHSGLRYLEKYFCHQDTHFIFLPCFCKSSSIFLPNLRASSSMWSKADSISEAGRKIKAMSFFRILCISGFFSLLLYFAHSPKALAFRMRACDKKHSKSSRENLLFQYNCFKKYNDFFKTCRKDSCLVFLKSWIFHMLKIFKDKKLRRFRKIK